MHLEESESIIKVSHHHPFPFIVRALKIAVVSFPFFLVASFFQGVLSGSAMFLFYASVTVFFILVMVHEGAIYFIDHIIITNRRIIHVNWKNLFSRIETEAEFKDIQDIETVENGIFSRWKIFDYGLLRIETASSNVSILFENANDPEGIKHFIYHLQIKPSKIKEASSETSLTYDSTRPAEETSTRFTGIEK